MVKWFKLFKGMCKKKHRGTAIGGDPYIYIYMCVFFFIVFIFFLWGGVVLGSVVLVGMTCGDGGARPSFVGGPCSDVLGCPVVPSFCLRV